MIWKLSAWNNRKFRKWVDDFNPDVIFFANEIYVAKSLVAGGAKTLFAPPLAVAISHEISRRRTSAAAEISNSAREKDLPHTCGKF